MPASGKDFSLIQHKTNAVIAAINSARDVYNKTGSGGWVETWNFTLTHSDEDRLYAYFVRSVNNYLLPDDGPASAVDARFIISLTGTLNRVNGL